MIVVLCLWDWGLSVLVGFPELSAVEPNYELRFYASVILHESRFPEQVHVPHLTWQEPERLFRAMQSDSGVHVSMTTPAAAHN